MLHVCHGLIYNVDDTEQYYHCQNKRSATAGRVIALCLQLLHFFCLFFTVVAVFLLYFLYLGSKQLRKRHILLLLYLKRQHCYFDYNSKYQYRPTEIL